MQFELRLALAFHRPDREKLIQELLTSGDLGYYRALFYLEGRIVDLSDEKKKAGQTPEDFLKRLETSNYG